MNFEQDWPWILMLALIGIYFAYFEIRAFNTKDDQVTLSMFVATIFARWPPAIGIVWFAVGFLLCHFTWSWPSNPLPGGG